MSEENEAIARRYFEEVINKGNLAAIDELFDPNLIFHDPAAPEDILGTEALRQFFAGLRLAFPDLHFSVEDLFSSGEKMAARWTLRGTHQGELAGIPPTGRQVTVTGLDLFHLSEGKIKEVWVELDMLDTMQQLGVIPPPA